MQRAVRVDAIVLAAGRSSRMGGPNKLMALFDGRPLVRLTAETARASRAGEVVVVTGHQDERMTAALAGLDVRRVHNRDYPSGLASSLKTGVRALSPDAAGALILLGDMPGVTAADLDRLIACLREIRRHRDRARHAWRQARQSGDPAARAVSRSRQARGRHRRAPHRRIAGNAVVDVEIGAGASVDVDTPEAMRLAGGVLQD